MGTRRAVTVLVVVGLLAVAGVWFAHRWPGDPPPRPTLRGCQAEADGTVTLETGQMANAATIAAVGVRLGMPERAVVVALATAMQESTLRNLPHLGQRNDHDSIGLFQQRPSQGWGSEAEIRDPRYATEQFYLALREIPGWQRLRITEAAQQVQRSAYPEAYQQWAGQARVLAGALLGVAGGAVTCAVPRSPETGGEAAVTALASTLSRDWGVPADAAAAAGLSVSADDRLTGWRYAHWLVSHAAAHGVTRVHFADLEWTAAQGRWLPADAASDHVLAEVAPPG